MSTDRPAPRKTPQQARSRALYDSILVAAAELLERDGPGFNLSDVAARAGVSAGSMYQYFPDRKGLIAALVDEQIARDRARLDQWRNANDVVPPANLAEAMVDGMLLLYAERPRLLTHMVQLLEELNRQRDVESIVDEFCGVLAQKLRAVRPLSEPEKCRDAALAAVIAVLSVVRRTSVTEPEKLGTNDFRARCVAIARAALELHENATERV